MKKHTLLKRFLGRHDWRESYRESNALFDIVTYICMTCGDKTERVERPDRGDLSLDPAVRDKQLESREREIERLRNRS